MTPEDHEHDLAPQPTAGGELRTTGTADAAAREPVVETPPAADAGAGTPDTFIGPRGPRWRVESVFVRVVATSGIVGISVALAAILGTQDVAYWITGLAVALVSVVLAAILWSSRTL